MNLEGTYKVNFGEKQVGSVEVKRVGLYYELQCRCSRCDGQMVELVAEGKGFWENLGLLLPMEGGLGLKMRIPVKRMGEGQRRFSLHLRHEEEENLIEVDADEPFAFLQQLESAHLVFRQGKAMIAFGKNI